MMVLEVSILEVLNNREVREPPHSSLRIKDKQTVTNVRQGLLGYLTCRNFG